MTRTVFPFLFTDKISKIELVIVNERKNVFGMIRKEEVIGYLLAFFLGGIGAHLFYFRIYKRGTIYLLFSWTGIPIVLGWVDMLFISTWGNKLNAKNKGSTSKETINLTKVTNTVLYGSVEKKKNEIEIVPDLTVETNNLHAPDFNQVENLNNTTRTFKQTTSIIEPVIEVELDNLKEEVLSTNEDESYIS